MPLISIEFFIFFLILFPIYWSFARRPKIQNLLLLVSGLGWLFYLSVFFTAVVIIFSLTIAVIAERIVSAKTEKGRKYSYLSGIMVTVINLCFFKYYDFFRPVFQQHLGDIADIVLPLGISYYSFQAISYLTSLYRNEVPQLKWHNLLFYFSFFLTITSGPISRVAGFKNQQEYYQGMGEQIETTQKREIGTLHIAVALILLGIAKKWWLAGSLADNIVTPVFENPSQYDLFAVLAGIYGYTFQLFFDFSGYSDLVIGLALLLGFNLPRNFNMPLISTNLKEFWQRWHISLSSWIRDYIYIPLGGSRKGFTITQINLVIAMGLSGIWHGYGANFLLWGVLHGLAFVFLNLLGLVFKKPLLSSIPVIGKILAVFVTFNFVAFAFVIFRTNNFEETLFIYQSVMDNTHGIAFENLSALFILTLFGLFLLVYRKLAQAYDEMWYRLSQLPLLLTVLVILVAAVLIILFAPEGIPAFIYANF